MQQGRVVGSVQQGGVVESVVSAAGWSCRVSGQCSRVEL